VFGIAARLLTAERRGLCGTADAPVKGNSPEAVLHGRLEARTRSMHILTFGGGTNEMQRDLIAIFGLGMPGSPR